MVEQSGRIAIVITGMHRSGTSALAKAISLAGADLPKRLVAATEANPLGHWEPASLVELNNQFLDENGSRWDDWRRLEITISPARLADFNAAIFEALKSSYEQYSLFVLKDPRICRFVPFYEAIIRRAGITPCYVLPYRNPMEVARSLESRDGMPIRYAQLLWARHVLDAEQATRGARRAFSTYDGLLADPVTCIEEIGADLGITWPRPPRTAEKAMSEFLNQDLRNFRTGTTEAPGQDVIEEFVQEIHQNLKCLKSRPNDQAALEKLDWLKSKLNNPCNEFRNAAPAQFAVEQTATGRTSHFQGRFFAEVRKWARQIVRRGKG